jgi:large subunit ribosomal protein L14e
MGDAEIVASRYVPSYISMADEIPLMIMAKPRCSWRLVEVGRVVLFSKPSPYDGRIAVIVEIVDHKRVLVDGPSESEDKVVPRHAAALSNLALTPIVMEKFPRAIGNGPLRKKWEEQEIEKKWEETQFAKNRVKSAKRRALNDFERFKVMRLRKQVRYEERKALAKIKASA